MPATMIDALEGLGYREPMLIQSLSIGHRVIASEDQPIPTPNPAPKLPLATS
jgi:hypothetical protein